MIKEIKEVSEESSPSSEDKNRYFKKRTRELLDEDKKENGLNSLLESEATLENKPQKKIKRAVPVSAEKSSSAQEPWILS